MAERSTLRIVKIKDEGPRARTLYVEKDGEVRPGQFFMITDYEGGEKPISVSEREGNLLGITIKEAGTFTRRLRAKREGDLLSLRGPYGTSFSLTPGKALLVGGGCGTAPLHYLTRALLEGGAEVVVVNGARNQGDILFGDRFAHLPVRYVEAVEDKSPGLTAVDAAGKILETETFDFVYSAGPELMMAALRRNLKDIPYEFLMERYMKCGVGLCGSCACDSLGIRLCVEGPVLRRELVEKLSDFGLYKRDAAGRRAGYVKTA